MREGGDEPASAISLSRPSLARAEDLTKRVRIETNVKASDWRKPMWYCGSALVWLNIASGIYYHKGDRWYGRTKRGAHICEKEAIGPPLVATKFGLLILQYFIAKEEMISVSPLLVSQLRVFQWRRAVELH